MIRNKISIWVCEPQAYTAMNLVHIDRRRLRPLMGTFCAIEATGPAEAIDEAVAQAFDVMTVVDQQMHPTRTGSDLEQMMANPGRTIAIAAMTWEVIALAQLICRLSGGVFDPCLPRSSGSVLDVELKPGLRVLCREPMALDLGGIAKGFAVDQAIEALERAGCVGGIVNAGGDLRAFGPIAYPVLVNASASDPIHLTLRDAAIASTDVESERRPSEHRGYYSRINGRRLTRTHAAILAPGAAIADALTKCALYCNSAEMNALMSRFSARMLDR